MKTSNPIHEPVKALLHTPAAGAHLRAIYSSTIRLCNGTGLPGHTCITYLEDFTTYCTVMFALEN